MRNLFVLPDFSALIPQKGTTAPKSEAMAPAVGASEEFAPIDHQHQRLSAGGNATLDSNGLALVPLNPIHTIEPVIIFGALGTGTGPVPDFRGELITNAAGEYVAVKVYGQRARQLPELAPLNGGVLVLLGSLISALNILLAGLSKFAPWEAAAGAQVSVLAVRPSVARVSPPYNFPT